MDATVEGPELEIAFNVKFLQDTLEAIEMKTIVMETNSHKTVLLGELIFLIRSMLLNGVFPEIRKHSSPGSFS